MRPPARGPAPERSQRHGREPAASRGWATATVTLPFGGPQARRFTMVIRYGRSGGSVATCRAKTTPAPHDAERSAAHQASSAMKRRPHLQLPRDPRRLLVCSPSACAPTPLGQGSSAAAPLSRPGFRVSRIGGGFLCCRTLRRDHRLRRLLPQPGKPQRWWDRPHRDHRRRSQSEVLHRPLEPVPESRVGRPSSHGRRLAPCPGTVFLSMTLTKPQCVLLRVVVSPALVFVEQPEAALLQHPQ
jgi:hypothetical protein